MLFVNADDIPVAVVPPRPRSADDLAPYAALLAAAETTALIDLDHRSVGRSVLVGGERRPADVMLAGDALLDDGTAVAAIMLTSRASHSLRDALRCRFVLISGVVRDRGGHLAIEAAEVVDLRAIARDWHGRR